MIILGISCYYHDSAAALIVDGKIVAAAAEERFSRIKHDSSFPRLAIDFCMRQAGATAKDLDWVVFYEKPFLKFERITLSHLATIPRARDSFVKAYKTFLKSKLWIKSTIAKQVGVPSGRILFSSHHTSHAASAFFTSPFESSAVLTADGVGEWATTAWGAGHGNKISLESEIKFPHSLGLFYSTFTQFLGFRINNGEFKVMGLAPYGEPRYADKVGRLINQSADGAYQLEMSYFNYHLSDKVSFSKKFVRTFGPPQDPKKSELVVKKCADIAASVQKVLEEKLLVIAKNIKEKTGEENLCYAGGVALNGVANWRIFREAGFKNIFIHPAAGDDGGALGAALWVYHHVLGRPRVSGMKHAYFGAENADRANFDFIQKSNLQYQKLDDERLAERVTDMIAAGKVVGMVRGRFEWGPRALGARSILADPRSKKMKDKVNAKIKFREPFRPFAPVGLLGDKDKYFDVGADYRQQPLGYMLAVVPVQEEWRSRLGAVTHVNGTARPQLVGRSQNKFYYDLVKGFGQKTGVNILLNTSFNLKGEPIVNTPEDAHKTFMRSGIDALVLGNYLIKKKR